MDIFQEDVNMSIRHVTITAHNAALRQCVSVGDANTLHDTHKYVYISAGMSISFAPILELPKCMRTHSDCLAIFPRARPCVVLRFPAPLPLSLAHSLFYSVFFLQVFLCHFCGCDQNKS